MAQGNWIDQNWVTDSPLLPRTRRAYVPSQGYQTASPQYNSYWSPQYRQTDYTQPIQNSKTPPINQALNETFQPQYIQTTDHNGQPVRVPANAGEQFEEYLQDALRWGLGQFTENLVLKNLTGKSLGDWAAIGARRFAPKVAGAIVGGPIGAAVPWVPEAVEGAKYLLSTPTAKTLGNGIKHVINWGL